MAPDRANARLEYWKSKLIDLSLRNKLINYRVGRASTVPVVDEIPRVVVERLLADERSFGFLPKPADGPAPEGGGEFAPVADEDLRADHTDAMLKTTLTPRELDKVLYNLFLKSRTSFEEQGVVTLFLAVGMLRWYEDQNAKDERVAPILLLPAILTRQGVGRPFLLTAAPAEPEVNPSLLRKLQVDFGVVPKLPGNGEALDPDAVLEAFRAVLPEPRWKVLTDMQLGLFSFSKYLMYRDLEDQADKLLENRTIARLAGLPVDPGEERTPPEPGDLAPRPPTEVHQILDADSSQQTAIEAVRQGMDLVLQGPPGTGKSQTIANLISESLADGKTVLFVSEKMAALEVVKRRLDRAGLGDYVLELHSRHAVKREVVAELARCLKRDRAGKPKDTGELDRLAEAREELDRYVAALHEPFGKGGLTPFDALGAIAANGEAPDLLFKFDAPEDVDRDDRAHLARLVTDLAAARRGLGGDGPHPWRFSMLTSVPRVVELEVAKLLGALREDAASLRLGLESSASALGLAIPATLDETRAHLEILKHLTRSPGPDAAWISDEHWAGSGTEGRALMERLRKYTDGRRKLLNTWSEGLFDLALDDLSERRHTHGTGLFRFLRPSWWKDRKLLATVRRPGAAPGPQEEIDDLALAVRVRDLGREIDAGAHRGAEIFGRFYKGRETDWEDIDSVAAWVAGLRKLGPVTPELAEAGRHPRDYDDPHTNGAAALAKVTRGLEAIAGQLRAKELPTVIAELISWPEAALAHPEGIHDQAAWRRALDDAGEKGLTSFVDAAEKAGLGPDDLPRVWEKGLAVLYLDRARAGRATLARFHREHHEEGLKRFRALDERQLALAVGRIRGRIDAEMPSSRSFSPESDVGLLLREAAKKRRHLPVRRLLTKAGAAVRRLKPCMMMSPISIAQYLPVQSEPFDLVVFDEASQICPEDAIGAIARGNQVVVVGDSRQLPPTSFFSYDPDLGENEDEEDPLPDLESILDLCATSGVSSLRLRWHYRSRDESLIAFSNHHFYEGGLYTFPNPGDRPGLGVEFHHVEDGRYDRGGSRQNRIEAQAVAAAVAAQIRAEPERSVGVVTFSEAQQLAVLDELDALLRADHELETLYGRNAEEPPFVKNLENVQGDERDVMIFSIGYGRDEGGKLTMNFGPLNGDGGHRRLNVAVTRARRAVRVFSSILPEDIDPERAKGQGARLLRSYLEYAKRGVAALDLDNVPALQREESRFEQAVAAAIAQEGFRVTRKVGASDYRLDLAIEHPEVAGAHLLGIECDGPTYRDASTTRDRDRTRPLVLSGLGWNLHRIWSPDWVRSPQRELERIREAVRAVPVSEPPPPPPPAPAPEPGPEPEPESGEPPLPEPPAGTPAASGDDDLPTAPPYEITPKSQRRPRREFDVESTELPRLVTAIVAFEGPIHREELSRRIADSYDTKHTRKVREGVARGIDLAVEEGKVRRHGDFLWPPGKRDCPMRGPVEGESPRDIDHVPNEEMEDGVRTVLGVDLRLPKDALTKAIAGLLGHRRNDRVVEAIQTVIDDMAGRGEVLLDGEFVSLPD